MNSVIINADDFGKDPHKVEWTIKGFEKKALTSATIMAGMPGTELAVKYALEHPEFSFGLHLQLAEGVPISNPDTIPTLVDKRTGRFWDMRQYVLRVNLGFIRKGDLRREIMAQYNSLASLGLKVHHIDGHGHVHRYPRVIKVIDTLKSELDIRTVRRVQDINLCQIGYIKCAIMKEWQNCITERFKSSDHFFMTTKQTTNPKWFSDFMRRGLPVGVTEIGIHPGNDKEWRRLDTDDVYSFDFSNVHMTNFNKLEQGVPNGSVE